MSFTYDLTTATGQMRLLLGDTAPDSLNFTDEELTACYNITTLQMSGSSDATPSGAPRDVLLYACAQAADVLATRVANSKNGRSVKLGDYQIVGKDQVSALQGIAQRFRDAVDNMPAWGIVQENLSEMNQAIIVRNWVLRTEI